MENIVVLMSDFGTKDGAAAVMEGVTARINPEVKIRHLTHLVEAFDIREGAFLLLANYWRYQPGAIFVAVIDPEVGTDRKMLFVESRDYCFFGPDNGLLWPIIKAERTESIIAFDGKALREVVYQATRDPYFLRPASAVFEGRDYFCVAAGLLSLGIVPPGREVKETEIRKLNFGLKKKKDIGIGRVVFIDDYGNLVIDCTKQDFDSFVGDRAYSISVKGKEISHISATYADGKKGELIAIFGGDFEHQTDGSFLEIAINEGNAVKELKIKKGDRIAIIRR